MVSNTVPNCLILDYLHHHRHYHPYHHHPRSTLTLTVTTTPRGRRHLATTATTAGTTARLCLHLRL